MKKNDKRNKTGPRPGYTKNGKKIGRPTIKTDALLERICAHIRDGMTYEQVCKLPGMPARSKLHEWAEKDQGVLAPDGSYVRPPFRDSLKQSREQRAETWADQIIVETDALPEDATHEQINRQRLKNGVRMYFISKDNKRFREDKGSVNVAVGVGVMIPEAKRLELLERHERALQAGDRGA